MRDDLRDADLVGLAGVGAGGSRSLVVSLELLPQPATTPATASSSDERHRRGPA